MFWGLFGDGLDPVRVVFLHPGATIDSDAGIPRQPGSSSGHLLAGRTHQGFSAQKRCPALT